MLNIVEQSDLARALPIVGEVRMWAGGGSMPEGWRLCDGGVENRIERITLFLVIGLAYTEGDDDITFNVPNFGRRIPIGTVGDPFVSRGDQFGAEIIGLSRDQIPLQSASVEDGTTSIPIVEDGSSHSGVNIMPPVLGINFIIYMGL